MKTGIQRKRLKLVITVLMLLVTAAFWIVPSNVAYMVAQHRDVLLGRYSVPRLSWLLLAIPIELLAMHILWASQEDKRKRIFQVTALSFSMVVAVLGLDLAARMFRKKIYVPADGYCHRAPGTTETGTTRDLPRTAFSFPTTPKGYPDFPYTLTVDKRGFRNKTNLERYDIVAVGDSFTEGSNVSDDQSWPAQLAAKSGRSVYNLGMSGTHPGNYLAALQRVGLGLSPKTVVCMLCEGNDLRNVNYESRGGFWRSVSKFYKSSPVRNAVEGLMVRCLATENRAASQEGSQLERALSWLPLAIPEGPGAKHYAFDVRDVLDHFADPQAWRDSDGCRKTFQYVRQMKEACRRKGARLIVVYAPDKPHVLLPIVQDRVSAQQVHAFMSLRREDLPPPDEMMGILLPRLEAMEAEVAAFCRREGIGFVSPTEELRQNIRQGSQVYFTYDQHWTPLGQEVVAGEVARYLAQEAPGAGGSAESRPASRPRDE